VPPTDRLPSWAGRGLALAGILLLALNLRTAVAAVSPIVSQINGDIPLGSIAVGVLGMLPPVFFALAGVTAPFVARRMGLDASMALGAAAMVLGHLMRAVAPDFPVLFLGTVVTLAGMGLGNILLPPVVKKYFPDRIGQVTAAYATLMSISTAVPAVSAAPIADSLGWRTSLGAWAVVASSALVPWVLLVVREHRDRRAAARATAVGQTVRSERDEHGDRRLRLWRSRVAWAIAIAFCASSLNAYALFAWLPLMLVDIAGVSRVQAGALLALYGLIGLPAALIVPVVAARMRRGVELLVFAGVVFFVAGYLGLLVAPAAAPGLWVALAGAGPLIYPVCLVLINLRSRNHHTSIALSGFVQTVGYSVGATGPLILGMLHAATGDWTAPILFLLASASLGGIAGVLLRRPGFVDDDALAGRGGISPAVPRDG